MTKLRKSLAAALTVAVIGASFSVTPAQAGSKTDLAKAIVGGLVVGAIIGATQRQPAPQPVVVVRPRHRHHHFGNGGFQRAGFGGQDCFTQEEVTIDRFGNRASSIREICR